MMIIILATALLLSPLTSTGNNNALAQSGSVDDAERELYELLLAGYRGCVKAQLAMNNFFASLGATPPGDPGDCGAPPEPPKPVQPLDCNQLNTCPTSPDPCADVVPTTLNSHDSHDRSRNSIPDYVYVQDLNIATGIPYEVDNAGKYAQAKILPIGLWLVSVPDFCRHQPPVRNVPPPEEPRNCDPWILAKAGLCVSKPPFGQGFSEVIQTRIIDKVLQGWVCSILKDFSKRGGSQFVDAVCRQE